MPNINDIIDKSDKEEDFPAENIPNLDLYMDQILTLFSDNLLNNGYAEEDLLTKTMINNYSKEKIILPIAGKKYNKTQIMQLLCIINLKQNLTLAEIKKLISVTDERDLDLQKAYTNSLQLKTSIKEDIDKTLKNELAQYNHVENREEALALALAISSCATYLNRICSQIVGFVGKDDKKEN